MIETKALILSGGKGTRLRPITHTSAKQLVPIANKPILFYGIEAIKEAGITDIGIIVGDTASEIKAAVGDGSTFGIKTTYIQQEAPLGLAHAVKIARGFVGKERFIVYLGDNLIIDGIKDFVHRFETNSPDCQILLAHVPNPQNFGVAELSGDSVVRLVEKPKEPKTDLALVGVYMFDESVFEATENIKPSWRNELEITDAIQYLIEKGSDVQFQIISGWWKDTGKLVDMLEANRMLLERLKTKIDGYVDDRSMVIYHCVDEYAANPGVDRPTVEMLERRLLQSADLVFTTSRSLYQQKRKHNPNTYYLPNVADVEHFRKALDTQTDVPEDLQRIRTPRAGFIGTISNYKMDLELLDYVATEMPDVSFVFVGPIGSGDPDTDVSRLARHGNVHLMGPRKYKDLPAYVKGFDVCLIPFSINRVTRNVFPMKFFEYLSPGKPVVSTPLPALSEYADYCRFASDKRQFVELVGEALRETDDKLHESRMALAERHSWHRQIADVSSIVLSQSGTQ